MRREEYLHILTEQIRCKMARATIEQEINDHIEDQKAEFLGEGMGQTEAEEAAIREMGDPIEVGLEMDRIHRPTMAWGMIALIVGLSLAGYLLRSIMYQTVLGIEQSAGKTEELFWVGTSSSWHTSLELPALLLGLVLMIGICYMDEDCGLCKTNLDRISGVTFHWTAGRRCENVWDNKIYHNAFRKYCIESD